MDVKALANATIENENITECSLKLKVRRQLTKELFTKSDDAVKGRSGEKITIISVYIVRGISKHKSTVSIQRASSSGCFSKASFNTPV
jgi:hypothetical protein